MHQELEAARQLSDEEDDPMAWAVARFWKRRAAPLVPSRSTGHMRRSAGGKRRGGGQSSAGHLAGAGLLKATWAPFALPGRPAHAVTPV